MRSFILRLGLGLVAGLSFVLLPGAGHAQNVGNLIGHVYDQSGVPLRGVTVTISSPTQIGGPKVEVTNDEGAFRFQGLFPGKFEVRASAPSLKTVVQQNVVVNGGSTTDLDLIMSVQTAEQSIEIVERAPAVNMADTTVGDSFDLDFLESLPLATRDYQGAAAITAGVTDSGNGNPQVRGGTYFSNKYTVDGFDTTDPVTNTFGQNFSFNAMANLQVTTAGVGAENASTSGGVINVVTRSGSNRFEVDGSLAYQDNNMTLFRDSADRGVTTRLMVGDVNVGGPILRDRIWFFTSLEAVSNTFTLPRDPNFPDHPSFEVLGFNGLGKVTWQATRRNKFDLKLTMSPGTFDNTSQSYLVEPEAEERQFQRTETALLTWQYTGEIYIRSLVGYMQQKLDTSPQRCQWDPNCLTVAPQIDILTGIQRGSGGTLSLDQRRNVQLSGEAEWTTDSRTFGGHSIKLTWSYRRAQRDLRSGITGDTIFNNLGTLPFSRTEVCSNDPKEDMGICRKNFFRSTISGDNGLFSLSDRWNPTRYLTIKPGVAFHLGSSRNDAGDTVANIRAFTPHLTAVWDATHDGRTKLSASIDGLADTGFLSLASFSSGRLYSRNCQWDDEAKAYIANCAASGGNSTRTVGLPCGPTGVGPDGRPCRTTLKTPRVWEGTLEAEREIFTGVALGGTFVYRKFVNQWEDAETNANWNTGGTALNREAPFKSGRSEFIYDLQTPPEANRLYRGFTVQLRKREGLLRAVANYTISKYEGPTDASFAGLFLDNPGQAGYFYGPLPSDSRHDVRLQATYQLRPWLSFGVGYSFISGGPYNRLSYDAVSQSFSRFQAQRGYDSRGNLDPTDDRPLRLPDLTSLDMQLRLGLEPLIKQRIDFWVDAFNLLSLRTTTSVIQQDGPFWGQPVGRRGPLSLRVGMRYRF